MGSASYINSLLLHTSAGRLFVRKQVKTYMAWATLWFLVSVPREKWVKDASLSLSGLSA